MKRSYRWMWSGCALMAAVALAVQGFTQEKKPDQPAQPETKPPQVQPEKKPGAPAPTEMTPEEMMKLWQELNPLTPQHQEMAKAVGKYDVLVRYRMAPDAPMRAHRGRRVERVPFAWRRGQVVGWQSGVSFSLADWGPGRTAR